MMLRDRRCVRAVLMSAAATLVVVGCGSGDDDGDASQTADEGASVDSSTAVTEPPVAEAQG